VVGERERAGGKMKRKRSMTWNHCEVLLKCTFLLKLLNCSFCVCSINEHERQNILSFVAVLLEIRSFNHTVFIYMFILEKKLIFMAVFV
jgi:hypothetical protein